MKFLNKKILAFQTNLLRARQKLAQEDGQWVMDHAVQIAICMALAGIALLLVTNFLRDTLSSLVESKITEFFNYN